MLNPISNYKTTNNNRFNHYNRSNVTFGAMRVKKKTVDGIIDAVGQYKGKRIYVKGHSSLDEDSGSSILLAKHFFKNFGIDLIPCVRSEQKRKLFIDKNKEIKTQLRKKPDLIFTVDFNDVLKIPKLLAEMFEGNWEGAPKALREWRKGEIFEGTPIIGVDHHLKTNSIKGDYYIDDTAKSCSGILVRMFQAKHIKMRVEDCKLAYCGMLSDYEKSGLVEIKNGKLTKLPKLFKDKNSLAVLNRAEKQLKKAARTEIYNHLDIMSRLTTDEKLFKESLSSRIKLSPNKKFAYVELEPNDKQWAKIGMDNDTSSSIIRWFRKKVIENSSEVLTIEQQEKFKNIKAIAVFYRTSPKPHGRYRVSIHSIDEFSIKLIKKAEELSGMKIGGGHPNRAGGKIDSVDKMKAHGFTNLLVRASETIS